LERLHKEKELIGVYISGHPLDKYKFEMEFLNSHSLLELDQQGLNLLDRDILVSGLVTGVRESVSKGGKPYMIFTLEDYSGSREIGLFGEKCASFRGFVVLNAQLYIKARGDKSYRDSDKLELNIMKIGFLENIVDEELRSLTINLPVERLDENLMLDLFELSDERGKVTLSFKIHTEEAVFEASSRRYRIRMDDVTKRKLEALDLSFRMN
jgi:DNA polymerase-3 subunit alpha